MSEQIDLKKITMNEYYQSYAAIIVVLISIGNFVLCIEQLVSHFTWGGLIATFIIMGVFAFMVVADDLLGKVPVTSYLGYLIVFDILIVILNHFAQVRTGVVNTILAMKGSPYNLYPLLFLILTIIGLILVNINYPLIGYFLLGAGITYTVFFQNDNIGISVSGKQFFVIYMVITAIWIVFYRLLDDYRSIDMEFSWYIILEYRLVSIFYALYSFVFACMLKSGQLTVSWRNITFFLDTLFHVKVVLPISIILFLMVSFTIFFSIGTIPVQISEKKKNDNQIKTNDLITIDMFAFVGLFFGYILIFCVKENYFTGNIILLFIYYMIFKKIKNGEWSKEIIEENYIKLVFSFLIILIIDLMISKGLILNLILTLILVIIVIHNVKNIRLELTTSWKEELKEAGKDPDSVYVRISDVIAEAIYRPKYWYCSVIAVILEAFAWLCTRSSIMVVNNGQSVERRIDGFSWISPDYMLILGLILVVSMVVMIIFHSKNKNMISAPAWMKAVVVAGVILASIALSNTHGNYIDINSSNGVQMDLNCAAMNKRDSVNRVSYYYLEGTLIGEKASEIVLNKDSEQQLPKQKDMNQYTIPLLDQKEIYMIKVTNSFGKTTYETYWHPALAQYFFDGRKAHI